MTLGIISIANTAVAQGHVIDVETGHPVDLFAGGSDATVALNLLLVAAIGIVSVLAAWGFRSALGRLRGGSIYR